MCLNSCSGRGRCHNGTCACLEGFIGDACEICKCQDDCSGRGACEENAGVCSCRCMEGFTGPSCLDDVKKLPIQPLGPKGKYSKANAVPQNVVCNYR